MVNCKVQLESLGYSSNGYKKILECIISFASFIEHQWAYSVKKKVGIYEFVIHKYIGMKGEMTTNESRMSKDQLITIGDLEKFKLELFAELSTYFKQQNTSSTLHWLKSSDVRKLLKISPGTLQNLRISGQLPFKKIGGTMYYSAKDVEAMLRPS